MPWVFTAVCRLLVVSRELFVVAVHGLLIAVAPLTVGPRL